MEFKIVREEGEKKIELHVFSINLPNWTNEILIKKGVKGLQKRIVELKRKKREDNLITYDKKILIDNNNWK